MGEKPELLFFDTFAHDNTEELNLDLVQFPKPVYVTEVRIIPLGARVQADFPGGVRLGATNPSQFQIEFFVNDLVKPGASSFETLGGVEYNQNGCITLDCVPKDPSVRKIPTDGLVLRGYYTTITLSVYGTLTNNITEQIAPPPPVAVVAPTIPVQPPPPIVEPPPIIASAAVVDGADWNQRGESAIPTLPLDFNAAYQPPYNPPPPEAAYVVQEYTEYYPDVPKDPRSYHHPPEVAAEWEGSKARGGRSSGDVAVVVVTGGADRDNRDRERPRDVTYQKGEKEHRSGGGDNSERRDRDRDRGYSSRGDRDRRDYSGRAGDSRGVSRDRDHDWDRERDRDRSSHGGRDRDRDRDRDGGDRRDRGDRSYGSKYDEGGYRRYSREERGDDREKKRPRTPPPPAQSPKRPHTPHGECKEPSPCCEVDSFSEEEIIVSAADPLWTKEDNKETKELVAAKDAAAQQAQKSPAKEVPPLIKTAPTEELGSALAVAAVAAPTQMDVEEFEPILSDEDILDEEIDYDYGSYTNNEDLIKLFIPGVTQLQRKCPETPPSCDEVLSTRIGIIDDYFKSSFTRYVLEDFPKLNVEIKEEFVHLCEKITTIFGDEANFAAIAKLHADPACELHDQVAYIISTVIDWLRIALCYEMALSQDQPPYKIRHIKCGVRLAEYCCNSAELLAVLAERGFNIHEVLLGLYDQEYMALSIKLMILKAIDTCLLHKLSIEAFLMGPNPVGGNCNGFYASKANGYAAVIEKIRSNSSVRLKFALNSILEKLNMFELLCKVQRILAGLRNLKISPTDVELLAQALEQISNAFLNGQFALSQPKRFLPVSAQFEIPRSGGGTSSTDRNIMIAFFEMFDALSCFFLLLTCKNTQDCARIRNPIFEIISELLKSHEGLKYLAGNCDILNPMLKCMIQSEEDVQYSMQDCVDVRLHVLGLELAYKVETFLHVQSLFQLDPNRLDCDDPDIVNLLHSLYCLTFTHTGRIFCAEVMGMGGNIRCLLQFFAELHARDRSDTALGKLKRSPSTGYVVDLLANTIMYGNGVTFLESHRHQIYQVVNNQHIFEEGVAARLEEIRAYLQPLENVTALNSDSIAHFVEVVSTQSENIPVLTGQLMTSLRVIKHLGISPHSPPPVLSDTGYTELKYKHAMLQLFSLDGLTALSRLLQRLCDHYRQPSLHTAVFVSSQGYLIVNVVGVCVELMKRMLMYVIQCRNTKFKDLTAIPVLLQTYNVLSLFPNTSCVHLQAQQVCKSIIDTLLVYTQPVSEEVHEKDSLNKTLWTLMCGEVIKHIVSSPCRFVSGLLVFSELLPLPLPIQSRCDLSPEEVAWSVNLRKLWSAHLHPHSCAIQEMVNKLCTTSNSQLLNLLRRVCVQLADLAATSALMIGRGMLDAVHKSVLPRSDDVAVSTVTVTAACTNYSARLLNFLACLVTHSTLKCAVLHLVQSSTVKGDDKYATLFKVLMQLLRVKDAASGSHVQAQECILSIVLSFCDAEITLVSDRGGEVPSDTYLANALPTKDLVALFTSAVLDHLQEDGSYVTYLPALRILILLTEHDYGFHHLRELLLKRSYTFEGLLRKFGDVFVKDSPECLGTLNTLMEFLQICVATEDVETPLPYTPRRMKMTAADVRQLVGWRVKAVVKTEDGEEGQGEQEQHALLQLQAMLKKISEEDAAFESLLEGVVAVVKIISADPPTGDTKEGILLPPEPLLPEPETLLAQFAGRSVYTTVDTYDERLTVRYWLSVPNEESENDNVSCDLIEIGRQNLTQDFNIAREIEKLCRICPLDNVDEKEKRDDDQKAKIKKPFVTPLRARGFPRTMQQRSDLFRSRAPNTSRPPSLHVDDFVALETCGAQPTGPTGYNKFSRDVLSSTRATSRGNRGRTLATSERSVQCRQMSWWGASLVRRPYQ